MKSNAMRRWWLMLLVVALFFVVGCDCGGDDDAADDDDDNDEEPDILSDDQGLKEAGVSPPPPMSVDPERPASYGTVDVTVEAPGATSIALTASGNGCGTVTTITGVSPLVISGNAAASGYCFLSAVATFASGDPQVLEGQFEVQAGDPDVPPVEVLGGVYTSAALPEPSGTAEAPAITGVDGPATYINGGSATFALAFTGTEAASQLAVAVAGFDGHFILPVDSVSGLVEFELTFDHDIFDQITAKASAVQIVVEMLDVIGQVSAAFDFLLDGVEVESGEVKISLSWDTFTDVDLHVTEPNGEVIYYSHKTSATGGQLDLDSNPGCSIDGINNENVYWPDGASPPGEYEVKAHMYSDCEEGGATGTVTMSFCGEDSPQVETFSLGPTGDYDLWSFTSLCGSHVAGTVKYEDFALTQAGLSATGSMVPVRFAKVQVVRFEDDEILAESKTNSEGKYDMGFVNDGETGYFVRVIAESGDANLKQSVTNLDAKFYSWETDLVFEDDEPDKTDLDLEISKAQQAGALNIFDVGVTAWQHAWVNTGRVMPEVKFLWTAGAKPLGKNSSFATRDGKIYLLGDAADPDEYDDVIIGHEYGHFVHNSISKSDSPGGQHYLNVRIVPTLAFGEGWATFFGVTANNPNSAIDFL